MLNLAMESGIDAEIFHYNLFFIGVKKAFNCFIIDKKERNITSLSLS